MRLGSVCNIEDISQKFDSIYSNVFGTEDNLAEFYSAKQKDTEDCATWSIRLEYLLINIAIITKGTTERASMNAIYQTLPHIFGRQGRSSIFVYFGCTGQQNWLICFVFIGIRWKQCISKSASDTFSGKRVDFLFGRSGTRLLQPLLK